MIVSLKTDRHLEKFRDIKLYASNPNSETEKKIKWFEYSIKNQTDDFLSDPDWFVMQWEDLTEEELPDVYLNDFPLEIDGWMIGRKGQGVKGLSMRTLPLKDDRGNYIQYPEERLVASYLKQGKKVYILKDEMMDALVA